MAQRVSHVLVSDLTDEEMAPDEGQTVEFGLDGITFEVDLFNDQAEELRGALERYIAVARRTGGRAKRGTAAKATGSGNRMSREESKAVRDWWRSQGNEIADRGRIPGDVVEAYQQRAGRSGLAAVS